MRRRGNAHGGSYVVDAGRTIVTVTLRSQRTQRTRIPITHTVTSTVTPFYGDILLSIADISGGRERAWLPSNSAGMITNGPPLEKRFSTFWLIQWIALRDLIWTHAILHYHAHTLSGHHPHSTFTFNAAFRLYLSFASFALIAFTPAFPLFPSSTNDDLIPRRMTCLISDSPSR
jgi:hypothetical protein